LRAEIVHSARDGSQSGSYQNASRDKTTLLHKDEREKRDRDYRSGMEDWRREEIPVLG